MNPRMRKNMRLSEPTRGEYRSDREYLICWEVWRRCMYGVGLTVDASPVHRMILDRYWQAGPEAAFAGTMEGAK